MKKKKSKSTANVTRKKSAPRCWSPEDLKLELENAYSRGFLVLPGSCIRSISVCNTAFESAFKVELPADGHIIIQLMNPA